MFSRILLAAMLIPSAHAQQLVGYFPQWGLYSSPPYTVANLISSHAADRLDQLNYAQASVGNGHCAIADPNADLTFVMSTVQAVDGIPDTPTQPLRGNFNQLLKLRKRFPHLKILISLEGRASDFAADAQPETRQRFVESCIDLLIRGNLGPNSRVPNLFDGIDVDWEYPRAEDGGNFLALLTEFRRQLDATRPNLVLTIATGPSPHMSGSPDFAAIARTVDRIGLMTYDAAGPWSHTTGLLAPFGPKLGGQASIAAYVALGVPADKLLLGVPFYGYGWHNVPKQDDGLGQLGEPLRGDHPYSQIAPLISATNLFRDPGNPTNGEPWLYDGDNFYTFDDPTSVAAKAAYAKSQHLGGLMLWQLGDDTPSGVLLQSAHHALRP